MSQDIIITTKVWQKMPYMRMESTTVGATTKIIQHPEAVYLYNSLKDKYIITTGEDMATTFTQKSLEELAKEIKESASLEVLESETINGKICTWIKRNYTVNEAPITVKQCIWNERGIPLKSESTILNTKTIIEYKNFIFEDIPNSTFEIPREKIEK